MYIYIKIFTVGTWFVGFFSVVFEFSLLVYIDHSRLSYRMNCSLLASTQKIRFDGHFVENGVKAT